MSYQPMAPPPPPPTPVATTAARPILPSKFKPSKAWYWIGGLLIAAGVIGAFVVLGIWAARASDAVDNFARMKVTADGGEQSFTFARAGTYTLYYEYRSEVDGERINNDEHDTPDQLQVTVTDANGAEIATRAYDDDFAFSVNDKLGPAFARVDIPAPGAYTIAITSDASAPFVVAIGKGVLQSIWPGWILGALAAFVLGVGLGLLAIIMTAVRRGRRKRELRREAQAAGAYGVPAAYAGAYTPAPAPTWTPAPAPSWDTPVTPPEGSAPPAPAPPAPPSGDDPWGPPR